MLLDQIHGIKARRESFVNSLVSVLRNRVNMAPFTKMGKTEREARFGGGKSKN